MAETDYPDIKGRKTEEFASQLDYILKNYTLISLKDYVDCINNGKKNPEGSCILTFDDGFKDHYLNVFPILRKKKVAGCFFPVTQPLTEATVPPVHQVHFLLAKLGSRVFSNEFNEILESNFAQHCDDFHIDEKATKTDKYKWDDKDIMAANLKYNVSIMPSDLKTKVLNRIFNKHFNDQEEFCQNLYMNFDEMKEMLSQGMSFGGHTHSHPMLSKLSKEEQAKEISDSKEILESGLGTTIDFFSYPYGNYNETTIKVLSEQGFSCALTTDFDVNKGRVNVFALKRLDTNHLSLR